MCLVLKMIVLILIILFSLERHFLAKVLKGQCIGMNIKQNVRMKKKANNCKYFSNQTLYELTDCFGLFKLKL